MKNSYSLSAGARLQAQRNRQTDGEHEIHENGDWLAIWIAIAVIVAIVGCAMYGYSIYTSVLP
jgi:hypothetical protein